MLVSLHSGTVARQALDSLLAKHEGPFSPVYPGDLDVEAHLDGPSLTFRYAASTPRGALFLGELAAVGFFGADAQQMLAPL